MKVICHQNPVPLSPSDGVAFSLFQQPKHSGVGRVGAGIPRDLIRAGVRPSERAWDFLAIALSVMAADQGCLRKKSPDGWTREIQLEVAVIDAEFWMTQTTSLESALAFLTGDIWQVTFHAGGIAPPRRRRHTRRRLTGDSVCLLSGGLDSLIGAVDAVTSGRRPVFVSQVSKGDAERQRIFAKSVGDSLTHQQLSHAIKPPGEAERSQRARSLVFLAFGVLAASVLPQHRRGDSVDLLVPENGFISLNVPLTPMRLGSLSTRTTHPYFLKQIQHILDTSGFNVLLSNPYQFRTKGEMLLECADQILLRQLAFDSTSCGRFERFQYRHCGRCVPCLVRRAAFSRWRVTDETEYIFKDLSINDGGHRQYDDVRSAVFATLLVEQSGIYAWAGDALNQMLLGDSLPFANLAERGIAELREFLDDIGAT